MKKYIFLFILFGFITCKDQSRSIKLRYFEKSQVIDCGSDLSPLLNEVLYHFENTLLEKYKPDDSQVTRAYGRFMYRGLSGTADYNNMIDEHAFNLKNALLSEGILKSNSNRSNLNYNHPVVECIVNNMKDKELSETIKALIETNTMDPQLLNTRLRDFGNQSMEDRYTALYVALDGYYQHLVTNRLFETVDNE